MNSDENPYEILGLEPTATLAEIKKTYRKSALQYHPDRQTSDEDRERCNGIFARLSAAYEMLSDEDQRARVDRRLERQKKDEEETSKSPKQEPKTSPPSSTPPSSDSQRKNPSSPESPTSKKDSAVPGTPKSKKEKYDKDYMKNRRNQPSTPSKTKKTWDNRAGATSAMEWGSPLASNKPKIPKPTNKKNQKSQDENSSFHDPFDVFRKVFEEEFGEEFVPGTDMATTATRNVPAATSQELVAAAASPSSSSVLTKKDKNTSKMGELPADNRPVAMKMKTKTIIHEDGTKETVTFTEITRPDNTVETILQNSSGQGEVYATKTGKTPSKKPKKSLHLNAAIKSPPFKAKEKANVNTKGLALLESGDDTEKKSKKDSISKKKKSSTEEKDADTKKDASEKVKLLEAPPKKGKKGNKEDAPTNKGKGEEETSKKGKKNDLPTKKDKKEEEPKKKGKKEDLTSNKNKRDEELSKKSKKGDPPAKKDKSPEDDPAESSPVKEKDQDKPARVGLLRKLGLRKKPAQ